MMKKDFLNSKQIKEKYISEFNNTEKQIRLTNYQINTHFVNQPFVEITGKDSGNFNVGFYDGEKLIHSSNLKSNMWSRASRKYFTDWNIKITRNGELIYDEKINLKGKRVYIAFDSSSLGDTLAWIPYVEEFRLKHDCELIVSTFWNKLFRKTYNKITFVEPNIVVHNLYAMYMLGWFYNDEMEPELPNTIPLQKSATNILGLDFKEIKPIIDFKPKSNPYKTKYVTIAKHSTAGLKYWNNETGWDELVHFLVKNGYKVVSVAKEGCDIKGVTSITDFSIENTMNVIHHSEFFIGLSSGLSWLSWAIGKHVVMISNFTEKDHEFTTNTTRIVNESVCNGCWNKKEFKFDKGDWNWCPVHKGTERQFECHKSITSNMVINQIKKLL